MVSNIVLIGMPAAGKSTVGVLLAKSLLMDFVDTDLIIQKKYKMSLCDIITERGSDAFIQLENDAIKEESFTNSVVATGGSAVYGEEAMQKLKENAKIVFLTLPIEEIKRRINDIHTRGVVIKNGATLDDLYAERLPLYKKYADITIDCSNLTAEECVDRIIESINN